MPHTFDVRAVDVFLRGDGGFRFCARIKASELVDERHGFGLPGHKGSTHRKGGHPQHGCNETPSIHVRLLDRAYAAQQIPNVGAMLMFLSAGREAQGALAGRTIPPEGVRLE